MVYLLVLDLVANVRIAKSHWLTCNGSLYFHYTQILQVSCPRSWLHNHQSTRLLLSCCSAILNMWLWSHGPTYLPELQSLCPARRRRREWKRMWSLLLRSLSKGCMWHFNYSLLGRTWSFGYTWMQGRWEMQYLFRKPLWHYKKKKNGVALTIGEQLKWYVIGDM